MRPENDNDIKVFHPSNEKKEHAEESADLSQDILLAVQELDAQRSISAAHKSSVRSSPKLRPKMRRGSAE